MQFYTNVSDNDCAAAISAVNLRAALPLDDLPLVESEDEAVADALGVSDRALAKMMQEGE
jgi:hypothetical protein